MYMSNSAVLAWHKLFTAVLNNRLKLYLESYDVLSEAQAGFRKEYSTSSDFMA